MTGVRQMGSMLGSAEDREEIRDLYARYAATIDDGDYDAWLECFTDDGVFESSRFGRHSGRDGLRRFTQIYRDSLGGAQVRHVCTNLLFRIEGDAATGSCYLIYYHCNDGKIQQAAVGHYRDTMRKTGGRWKFQSRKVALDGHD
jgi:uncharacterized protein (TIGR02246 family)